MTKVVDTHGRFLAIASASFEQLKQRIADNIRRKGKWASGKTAESMQVVQFEAEGLSAVTLYGRQDFETLETGNPPADRPLREFRDVLYKWSIDKGIPFKAENARLFFAFRNAVRINEEGDRQYRSGTRADVYTTAAQETAQDIEKQMSTVVGRWASELASEILREL